MIMKRLTPEQALRAFIENKQIYTLTQVDPTITVEELIHSEWFVVFEDTETIQQAAAKPEPDTEPAGRSEATEASDTAAVANTEQKPKRGRPRKMTDAA